MVQETLFSEQTEVLLTYDMLKNNEMLRFVCFCFAYKHPFA